MKLNLPRVRCTFTTVLLGVAVLPFASGADRGGPATAEKRPAIRSFDLDTLGALGREIYRHDTLAWVATDTLFAEVDQKKLAEEGGAGWVVDTSGESAMVRFVREQGDTVEASYDVVFPKDGKPHVVVPGDRSLTKDQLARFHAARTAINTLIERRLPWCGGNPNFVVLPDPDGSGFLAYVLRAKPATDAVPIGGHYRITVADDGKTVEQVDQLFASCLTLSRHAPETKGGDIVALSVTHVVSDTPLETHVFLSLQEKLPFSVITGDGRLWTVADGAIKKMN